MKLWRRYISFNIIDKLWLILIYFLYWSCFNNWGRFLIKLYFWVCSFNKFLLRSCYSCITLVLDKLVRIIWFLNILFSFCSFWCWYFCICLCIWYGNCIVYFFYSNYRWFCFGCFFFWIFLRMVDCCVVRGRKLRSIVGCIWIKIDFVIVFGWC